MSKVSRLSGVFIVNFIVILTLSPNVSIISVEQVNVCWETFTHP